MNPSNNTTWHVLQSYLLSNLQALSWPLILVCLFFPCSHVTSISYDSFVHMGIAGLEPKSEAALDCLTRFTHIMIQTLHFLLTP